MYPNGDPRRALREEQVAAAPSTGRRTTTLDVASAAADHCLDGAGRSWVLKDEGFTAAFSELGAGESMTVGATGTDYLFFVADVVRLDVLNVADDSNVTVGEPSVVLASGSALRLTSSTDTAIVWALPAAVNVLELTEESESDMAVGEILKVFPLSAVPQDPSRFGRIFTSRNVMMNVLDIPDGPRDPHTVSPHSHDFAQCTVTLEGEFIHDLRVPWGPDVNTWVEDEHRPCGSPSLTLIPPGVVHTLRWGDGPNRVVDIFGPPRNDFLRQGWVLNPNDGPHRGR